VQPQDYGYVAAFHAECTRPGLAPVAHSLPAPMRMARGCINIASLRTTPDLRHHRRPLAMRLGRFPRHAGSSGAINVAPACQSDLGKLPAMTGTQSCRRRWSRNAPTVMPPGPLRFLRRQYRVVSCPWNPTATCARLNAPDSRRDAAALSRRHCTRRMIFPRCMILRSLGRPAPDLTRPPMTL
jgi:hypothetical protein